MAGPVRVLVHADDTTAAQIADAVRGTEVVAITDRTEADAAPPEGDVLLTFPWGADQLAAILAGGVEWVHTLSTGVDRFPLELIDGQVLTCSRGAHSHAIAEFVVAAMLAFEKQFPDVWLESEPENWYGARLGSLRGRTVGIAGAGSIATSTARLLEPFGADVVAYRRRNAPSPHPRMSLAGSLDEVAARSDHFLIAVPATAHTRGMFADEFFRAAKPGVHVVNIARGSLVDTDALRRALDAGTVAAATLDVVDPEPLPAGHWIYTDSRVRLSPHVSWSAPGARAAMLDVFIRNLRRYVAGEPLEHVVDTEAGY